FSRTLARHEKIAAVTRAGKHLPVPVTAECPRPPQIEVDGPQLAERDPHGTTAAEPRLLRHHVQDPARGSCAIQRGAWPAHELHAREVVKREPDCRPFLCAEERGGWIAAVNEHRDPAIE